MCELREHLLDPVGLDVVGDQEYFISWVPSLLLALFYIYMSFLDELYERLLGLDGVSLGCGIVGFRVEGLEVRHGVSQ